MAVPVLALFAIAMLTLLAPVWFWPIGWGIAVLGFFALDRYDRKWWRKYFGKERPY
jgi:hypothetical protein